VFEIILARDEKCQLGGFMLLHTINDNQRMKKMN
jgi:hypothetical protein